MSGACVVKWQSFTKADAQKFPMGGKNRPKSGTGGIRAAHTIAYTAQMRFTALQLDDAYRWRCQQRKHFPSDADIWHLRFRSIPSSNTPCCTRIRRLTSL